MLRLFTKTLQFKSRLLTTTQLLMSTRKPSLVTEEETLENLSREMRREMGKIGNENILQAAQQELRSQ